MSEELESKIWNQLTLLLEDSPAKMSQSQGRRPESRKEPGQDSGLSSTESFANYDPATSSWRTSQACLLTGWELFSQTWPTQGTMRNGRCYRQRMSVRPTSESESSSWPTPRTSDCRGASQPRVQKIREGDSPHKYQLREAAQVWPTPTARDFKDTGENVNWEKVAKKSRLAGAVMWPISPPDTSGQLNPTWVEWLMGFPLGWTDLRDSAML